MLIIGLTGSIGMGKTVAAQRFRERGIPVFDADRAVHELYEGPAVAAVEAAFPGSTADGKVDRAKLSAALLAQPQKFAVLEAIVHPLVRHAERAFVRAQSAKGARLVVLEVPLLLETGGDKIVDVIIVVSAPADVQSARVLARPGMTTAKLERLLRRQLPDEKKRAKADFVVDTSGAVAACNAQVDAIIAHIEQRPGHAFEKHWA